MKIFRASLLILINFSNANKCGCWKCETKTGLRSGCEFDADCVINMVQKEYPTCSKCDDGADGDNNDRVDNEGSCEDATVTECNKSQSKNWCFQGSRKAINVQIGVGDVCKTDYIIVSNRIDSKSRYYFENLHLIPLFRGLINQVRVRQTFWVELRF